MLSPLSSKKIGVLFFLASIVSFSNAQSLEFGLRGALASGWFLNGNLLKGGTEQNYDFALSHNIGFHAAWNITHNYGIELEVIDATLSEGYSGQFTNNGEFPGNGASYQAGQSYTAETQLHVIQIPILFRYEHDITGKYIEAGLGYEIINSATYSATYTGPAYSVSDNITNQFPNNDFLAIVGIGWDKRLSHDSKFYFNFGFRLTYGLFDLGGVDGHGQDITGPKSVILYELPDPYYSTYHATHALDFSVNAGLFYRFYPHIMVHKMKVDF